MKSCSKCGTINRDEARFCTRCGAKHEPSSMLEPMANTNPALTNTSESQPSERTAQVASKTPAVDPEPAPTPPTKEYYYLDETNQPTGPHTIQDLAAMAAVGRIIKTTLIAADGDPEWKPWEAVGGIGTVSMIDEEAMEPVQHSEKTSTLNQPSSVVTEAAEIAAAGDPECKPQTVISSTNNKWVVWGAIGLVTGALIGWTAGASDNADPGVISICGVILWYIMALVVGIMVGLEAIASFQIAGVILGFIAGGIFGCVSGLLVMGSSSHGGNVLGTLAGALVGTILWSLFGWGVNWSRKMRKARITILKERQVAQADLPTANKGFFAPEKKGIEKGVLGGVSMMAIAVIWFVVGYSCGYIFYYPPILFIIGLYALIKGLSTGNLAGNKRDKKHGILNPNNHMKHCSNCGAQSRDESQFCNSCGTKFESPQVVAQNDLAPVPESGQLEKTP